jgi:hypothetical protein
MAENNSSETVKINGKILQYGVLSSEDGRGYQVYLYPGMTVAEIAFNVMVTIRLLEQGCYLNTKEEFDALVNRYYTDPQYAPLEVPDGTDNNG